MALAAGMGEEVLSGSPQAPRGGRSKAESLNRFRPPMPKIRLKRACLTARRSFGLFPFLGGKSSRKSVYWSFHIACPMRFGYASATVDGRKLYLSSKGPGPPHAKSDGRAHRTNKRDTGMRSLIPFGSLTAYRSSLPGSSLSISSSILPVLQAPEFNSKMNTRVWRARLTLLIERESTRTLISRGPIGESKNSTSA